MKKKVKIVLLILLLLMILYVIQDLLFGRKYWIGKVIEIWVPLISRSEYEDTHGGFHGDGDSIDKIYFNDFQAKIFLKKVKKNKNWRKLPVTHELYTRIQYNLDGFNITIPEIENGYWFFKNRYTDAANVYDENGIYNVGAFNYSVGIYDQDTNILWFYECDT